MARSVEVTVDVSSAVDLGEVLHTKATVTYPDPQDLQARPIVCFGFPGGGYSRGYFTFDMPGSSVGGQAGWHADRGWVFVSCDHVYVGESDYPSEPGLLTLENLAAANAAAVEWVSSKLRDGSLTGDLPPIPDFTRIGIGQSMGGCLTIVQQGQHATYDGIGILGYSAHHTVLAMPPGGPEAAAPWVPRGSTSVRVLRSPQTSTNPDFRAREDGLPISTWGFHHDDEPADIVGEDMTDYPTRHGKKLPWASATTPPIATTMMSPGVVAPEAAAITAPVLVAVGERDVCPAPKFEPLSYQSSSDITVYVCPQMSHMHNFASTRTLFWTRIESWATGVAAAKAQR
ncbi:hypothetical protein ACSMXN_06155 [Jatrophihabitans sp. DSM 45814]